MKIAIAGYGVEGKASYDYWRTGDSELVVVDEREHVDVPAGVAAIVGADAFSKLASFDRIIRSPSISPEKLPYGDKVWSATNEFFAQCPAPIIGVTGTKGKGTTCSLIVAILRAAGKTVHLVGNIGTPALEVLPQIQPGDIVVYELSSFQLWDLEKSPHVAVVLPIEADHLDVHSSFDEYLAAKTNIAAHQTADDFVIFNKNNEYARRIAAASPAQKIEYPFAIEEFVPSLQLPGAHNQENAAAAIAVARLFDMSAEAIKDGLKSFTGLSHRLKFVAEKQGVKWYDDSIATTPGSAIAAINSFEQPKVLLLGGHDKGSDYTELMKKCAEKNVHVVAYGANREQLKELCDSAGVRCDVEAGDMQVVVAYAAHIATPGSVVVLSPAAASFDMFRNYADRGEQFIAAVHQLAD